MRRFCPIAPPVQEDGSHFPIMEHPEVELSVSTHSWALEDPFWHQPGTRCMPAPEQGPFFRKHSHNVACGTPVILRLPRRYRPFKQRLCHQCLPSPIRQKTMPSGTHFTNAKKNSECKKRTIAGQWSPRRAGGSLRLRLQGHAGLAEKQHDGLQGGVA